MTALTPLTIYGHYVSQPTRAVLWALQIKAVPFKFIKVDPTSGECETPQFLAKFPAGVAPAMEDAGLCLTESNAILTYLAQKHQWNDWYPASDLPKRATIDQWLHWHHTNVRPATTSFFRHGLRAVVKQAATGKPVDESVIDKMRIAFKEGDKILDETMAILTHGPLKETPFLVGNEPTIADIAFYCEFDQLLATGPATYDFGRHAKVLAWFERMKAMPHHDEVRRSLFKLTAALKPIAERVRAPKSAL